VNIINWQEFFGPPCVFKLLEEAALITYVCYLLAS